MQQAIPGEDTYTETQEEIHQAYLGVMGGSLFK